MLRPALLASLSLSLCFAASCTIEIPSSTSETPAMDASQQDTEVDAGLACSCRSGLHSDRIYVLSQDARLFTFNPADNSFEFQAKLHCAGGSRAFSMAVDLMGRAWILFAETQRLYTVDLSAPDLCTETAYHPDDEDFALFGMTFTGKGTDSCSKLFVQSYDGVGGFGEGPSMGSFGVIDGESGDLTNVGPIDYNGGELAGTGDGRLVSLTGVDPAKLVEFDPLTSSVVRTLPLEGISKTNASAMALYRGDAFLFTEAQPAGCETCMKVSCDDALEECLEDSTCAEHMVCAIEKSEISDSCGGLASEDVQECLLDTCANECMVPLVDRVSQVTRVAFSTIEDEGFHPTVVNSAAPIRIVGAGNSPCVPSAPN